jgi:predicted acetyltransferase
MDPVELITPRESLEGSHRTFVEEFRAKGERVVPWVADEPYDTFADYVAKLNDGPKGIGLRPEMVPHSTFWLIDSRGEIVAVSNLRHALTEYLLRFGGHIGYGVRPSARRQGYATEILRQTLREAHALGLRQIRLTCDKDNVASARTILRNGGDLDGEEFFADEQRIISRYWISLP